MPDPNETPETLVDSRDPDNLVEEEDGPPEEKVAEETMPTFDEEDLSI